ncbi:YaaA family protein [Williamsia sp. CHRR-6]|uniref:YaaA family protein n=1 Tax=Williamsia sp. CHRR-6 TaxID=2835871 RepID=UPI001BDB6A88|nr:peroxide stress protein YaaA [Williamsia sp. CHRR-6]MBT0568403.1 peroxide stress protein YaaA [Williamsia sp. CHRR-6]
MLIILPPSETKSDGGTGPALRLEGLTLPTLTPIRRRIADALVDLADDVEASAAALGLGRTQLAEVARNASLFSAPTRPALERYTGVLYDAIDVAALSAAARRRADERLLIGSALFGVVGATDLIPAYRLSAASRLPNLGTLGSQWKPDLTTALNGLGSDLVVDLRSGGYRALGPVPGAVEVTVLTEKPDGTRSVVSHFNKHHKGVLVSSLLRSRRTVHDINVLAAVAAGGGQRTEIASDRELVILTD